MPCCVPDLLCPALSLAREYNFDLEVDHLDSGQEYFSIMGVIKELVIKSYNNASFYANPDDSKSQSGYILKVGAIS